jgi:hypothetical protein
MLLHAYFERSQAEGRPLTRFLARKLREHWALVP